MPDGRDQFAGGQRDGAIIASGGMTEPLFVEHLCQFLSL